MKTHKLFIGGKWQEGKDQKIISFPFNGEKVAVSHQADATQMEEALRVSAEAFEVFRKVSRFTRSRLLSVMAREIGTRRKDLVESLIMEAGKPKLMAEVEVNRAVMTFTLASETTKTWGGEIVPLDLDAGGRAYSAATSMFVPRGPVLAITPFNFPLNLVAHKIAPALAIGTTVVLKPPPQAPGCSVILAEIFEKAAAEVSENKESVPLGALQVLSAPNEVISVAVKDPRLAILSFTGSDKVGWMLQGQAIRKKVLLELGGNAAVIVHADADISRAAARCANGGLSYAGQTCISVQRIYVHESVYEAFLKEITAEVARVKVGDPRSDDVVVGPVIDDGAAKRIASWVSEALADGAQVIGGGGQGQLLNPIILTGVKKEHKVNCEEIFGPVIVVDKYKSFSEAIKKVNDSRFGLQAGIFTDKASLIQQAFDDLEVGGVIVNDVPTYRADNMPYGGVKDSGLGREGVKYAMEDYCERRLLVSWKGF